MPRQPRPAVSERLEALYADLSSPEAVAYARATAASLIEHSYHWPAAGALSGRATEIIRAKVEQAIRGG